MEPVKHEKGHNNLEYNQKCDFCGRQKKRDTDITKTQRTCAKNGEKEFVCKMCDSAIQGVPNMLSHIWSEHEMFGDFICDLCHSLFMTEEGLNDHLKDRQCTRLSRAGASPRS